MRASYLGVLLLFLSQTNSAEGPVPSISGDYCKDQIIDVFTTKFGKDIEFSAWGKVTQGKDGRDLVYWVETNICAGTFYVRVPVRTDNCAQEHFFYVPRYVNAIYAEGACKSVFADDYQVSSDDFSRIYYRKEP